METLSRMTMPTRAVLTALRSGRSYGLEIADKCAMRTGTVYVVLARLERAGLAASSWEDRDSPGEAKDAGARRRYWELTPEGLAVAGRLPRGELS